MNDKKNIYDIAKEAGVSIATVSRVLSGQQNVTSATVQKVMLVIEKYNFRPSAMARGLYHQHSKTLGIILPKMTNPYYAQMYAAAEEEARQHKYVLILFHPPRGKSIDRELADTLMERRLDGLAINGEFLASTKTPDDIAMIHEICQYMPVVLLGCMIEELPCKTVITDLSGCIQLSMAHLVALGHTRIALLCGNDDLSIAYSRDVGYREALEKAGLPYRPEYRIFGDCTTRGGRDAMQALLDALPKTDWPTAVIAANDLVALGAMKHLMDRGLSIPSDISIIGSDNQFFSAYTSPALTTLDTQPQEAGIRAVSMMISSQEDSLCTHHLISCTLIPRESCGPCLL